MTLLILQPPHPKALANFGAAAFQVPFRRVEENIGPGLALVKH
jgi:hypothetical protein